MKPLNEEHLAILRRRGLVPAFGLDGGLAGIAWRSPLAQLQARSEASGTLMWLETVRALGPEAARTADPAAASRWLANLLGVPPDLVISPAEEVHAITAGAALATPRTDDDALPHGLDPAA